MLRKIFHFFTDESDESDGDELEVRKAQLMEKQSNNIQRMEEFTRQLEQNRQLIAAKLQEMEITRQALADSYTADRKNTQLVINKIHQLSFFSNSPSSLTPDPNFSVHAKDDIGVRYGNYSR